MPFVVTCCAFKTHRANGRGRGKPVLIYILACSLGFHAITLKHSSFTKMRDVVRRVSAHARLHLATMDRQSTEDAFRRRRERERQRRARETPEQREAMLSQRRLRDRERPRERRTAETAEEREARLARRRVQHRARRAAE